MTWFTIPGINPEPWTPPSLGTKRVGHKVVPIVFKHEGLKAYQEGVRDSLRTTYPDHIPSTAEIELTFLFWRQLPVYEGVKGKVQKHVADNTNLQKALEDALQSVLFKNDRQVKACFSEIVEQGPDVAPFIAVQMLNYIDTIFPIPQWLEDERLRGEPVVTIPERDINVESFF